MEPFDPLDTPLSGINLIEASAGTGKTYAIENLFLRLILESRLSVEQILVVTFTKAATEELKTRIRSRLAAAQTALAQGASDDPLLSALIRKNTQGHGRELIQHALMNFDQAPIFTIHGFCQRVLHEHAFETGSLFDTELITDQTDLLLKIADDFWRTHLYHAEPEVAYHAIERLKGPEYFLNLIQRWGQSDLKIIPKALKPHLSLQPYREIFAKLQTAWPQSRAAAAQALLSPSLKDNIYGSLKPNRGGAHQSVREIKVQGLLLQMDALAGSSGHAAAIFKNIDKFTTTRLNSAVKSGRPAPRLNFFDLCDQLVQKGNTLVAELDAYLLYLKTIFFQYAADEMVKRKNESNIQFFDDLLLKVKNALADPVGHELVTAVRRKYKAALVDEFQDTDPLQYQIFSHLFSSPEQVLFMIGDPKQAIYGFRGADIFTYMQASRTVPRKYTLTKNWRSDPGMITAVNTLFDRVRFPFLFRDIDFYKATSGRENVAGAGPAMTIWYARGEEGKALSKKHASEIFADRTSAEIFNLLYAAPEPVPAGNMAVLVRTNRQARIIKKKLARARVPAVVCSTGNVFESHEAMEMERLLASIAEPNNDRRLRAALVTDMMGGDAEMFCLSEKAPDGWEFRRLRFREYFQLWEKHGFMQMLRRLLLKEKIRTRLMAFSDGERRLTNVLHLAELLQQESIEKKKGITALVKWLAEQRRNSAPGIETNQLRLESDADAVKIVTIHKSKGLEYPIVFCPFLWDGSLSRQEAVCFHDPVDGRMTLDLSGNKDAGRRSLSEKELLAEAIRLLYVAVTRAKKRCYLAWGRINTVETAPMSYLLHHAAEGSENDVVNALQKEIPLKSDTELIHDLHKLSADSEGSIEIAELPVCAPAARPAVQPKPPGRLTCRKFSGKIDWSWRIFSYSTLVSRTVAAETFPDRDTAERPAAAIRPDSGALEQRDIFSFPRGSHAGNFFHDIFENLDFSQTEEASCSRLVELKLAEYGFSPTWKDTVCGTIRNVVSVPLGGDSGIFTLSSILNHGRLNELEFYFPLASITPRKLKKILIDCGMGDVPETPPDRLENLVFTPARGFMKGFMDLVFRFQDRFYLIDWKSNFLGPTLADYRRESLVKVMRDEWYFLQYQIYTLAMHQYLQHRLPGYRYEKHFGGVFYIFLRGVDPAHGQEFGIFRDIPSPDSIYSMAKALISE